MPRTFRNVLGAVVGLLALTLVTGLAADAAPVPGLYSDAIDHLEDYDGQETCDPVAKPGVEEFRDLVLSTYAGTGDYGIVRDCSSGGQSEHKEGRAWDWRVSAVSQHEVADDLLDWLLAPDHYGNNHAMARRFGIMYIIFDHRIWGAYDADEGWRDYTGPNPHTDHVHFSFGWDGAREDTTWWTDAASGLLVDESGIAVARRNNKHADAFGVSDDNQLTHRKQRGDTWSAWESLGGEISSAPAAGWRTRKSLEIFVRGTNGILYHRQRASGDWMGWENLGVSVRSAPAVAVHDKRADVVVVDAGGFLKTAQLRNRGLGEWSTIPAGPVTAPPAAVWTSLGLEVFVRGGNGEVWHAVRADGVWSGWESLGGTLTSGPGAVAYGDGSVAVVGRVSDGSAWSRERTSGVWAAWKGLGGYLASGASAAPRPRARPGYAVEVRGNNGRMYERQINPGEDLGGWVEW